ncbi:hypothetical protein RRG08_005949 [Elysia crispata]|uniref:Uncharacterized protein n=1 Tax=Elysia crispata TaxID=231223 RepID=A0AAE0XSK9_9GAST|nr:hypothetical protein RRG08_005949 [Elysia crispata]
MASQKRIKTSDIYANDCESKYGLDSVSSATWITESKLNQWDQEDFGCIPLLDESLHIPRPLPKDRRESRHTSSRLQNNPTSGRQELVK